MFQSKYLYMTCKNKYMYMCKTPSTNQYKNYKSLRMNLDTRHYKYHYN